MSEQEQPNETGASEAVGAEPPAQRGGNKSGTAASTRNNILPIHRLSIPIMQPASGVVLENTSAGLLHIPPHTAARVLKGEIHNVLTVLRADSRYVSPHRFDDESVEQYEHPLLARFRDLHATLCAWESAPQTDVPDAMLYLPPFCEAIQARDISASVTGSALSAMHKFLLYGFLTNTSSAAKGMTCMAAALLQCTFEESTQGAMIPAGSAGPVKYFEPGGGFSASAIASLDAANSNRGLGSIRRSLSTETARSSGTTQPLHHQHNIHSREGTNISRTVVGTMLLHDDEQVVLKLLELSALVVRCSLNPSEPLVSPNLIVGLLDTCLHVSHRAKRASPLLKSAAADSLGQIVLQVFSTITTPPRSCLGRSNTIDTIETTESTHNSPAPQNGEDSNDYSPLLRTRKEILLKLTNLLNPQQNNDATCATSLTLMNMAFETLRDEFTLPEIAILQNDFCKYLLQWSTTHDLMILNLTLRVIFNLFQSMRNHLKVPLEVFLTSVHLRILDPTSSATSEEREVALESLLEFCQEVALMQDVYLNYDCDISCTNLYESICTTLGRVACADGSSNRIMLTPNTPSLILSSGMTLPTTAESVTSSSGISFDHNNLPGGLASFRNQPSVRHMNTKSGVATAATATIAADDSSTLISDISSHGGTSAHLHSPRRDGKSTLTGMVGASQAPQIPLNILNKLALDGILAILDSIFRRCQSHLRYEDMMQQNGVGGINNDGGSLDGASVAASEASQLGNLRWQMAPMTEEDLQKRKIKKHFLEIISKAFNENPFADKWILIAKENDILPSFLPPKNPSLSDTRVLHKLGVAPDDVGDLLYSTQGLNKASVGEYISKGPKEKYPFHAQVLCGFVRRYDFSDVTFAGAIRKFLSKFRLPGEAQCIDRLMEAFSKEYYEQKGRQAQEVSTKHMSESGGKVEGKGAVAVKAERDHTEASKEVKKFVFKSADAVFVLSFSTIMLNTDLHNPSMRRNRRMTLQQFIKNNRGINDGDNIPDEFLAELYDQIKTEEIQVQAEVGEFFSMTQTMMSSATGATTASSMEAFRASWESVLSNRKQNVAAAFFTSPYAARQSIERAGIHDKEMFVTIASCGAVQSLAGVFCRSWDDDLVVRALRGMKQMAKMCEFFETDDILNDLLQILLRLGRDYIMGCTALEHSGYDSGAPILPNGRLPMAVLGEDNDESAIIDTESPVPTSLLCSSKGVDPLHASFAVHAKQNVGLATGSSGDGENRQDEGYEISDGEDDLVDVSGSSAHRGLLALDTAFLMLRSYAPRVREAWPAFIDCICALRDSRGLPAGLSDLDDFADSNGNVLPLSSYAQMSQKRLDDHYRALLGKDDANKKKSWLRSFFGAEKKDSKKDGSVIGGESERSAISGSNTGGSYANPSLKEELSTFSLRLLDVAENCDVEKVVVQMGSSTGNEDQSAPPEQLLHQEQQFIAMQALLMSVDEYPFDDDPVMEQHAIFSLELAARALLTNRERSTELFSLFLLKFESILSKVDDHRIPAPFMVERVVVTILRSSIHLYDLPELRPHLRASLHLLMMSLPRKFISQISDRMACGLAIILRASFHFFETPNEWTFMGDTLDMLANYQAARGFVFDGIASTVEYALPSPPDDVDSTHLTAESASTLTFENKEDESSNGNSDPTEHPPPLSKDACVALTRILIRFVLGFYQNDLSLSLPAMLCLEKVYRHLVLLLVPPEDEKGESKDGVEGACVNGRIPDKELWQNVIVSVYSVCRSVDEESSRCGMECYSRLMRETRVDEISDDKWLAILYLMVNKQPPLSADVARANTFAVLGQVLMMVLPPLSHRSENWEDLTDLVQQIAAVSEENLREGRKGSVSLLFQKTVQTVTDCANSMMSEDFDGDKEFSTWASETLLAELEKFGALGGSIMNVAATK